MKKSIYASISNTGEPRILLIGMIILIILVATWLRLPMLTVVPPGMWFDEAYNALEALGMLESVTFPIFLIGNNGREAMLFYLLAMAIKVFGVKLYTIRFVVAVVGIITVPLLFRLVTGLFRQDSYRYWLGVVASAGLATSFWHLSISRVGLRVTLLLPFVILCTYFFYRGLETRRYRHFIGAGVALGLSQYTYLMARLLPLSLIMFGIGYSFLYWRSDSSRVMFLWRGIALIGFAAGVIFLPMALFFLFTPEVFTDRIEDVALNPQQTLPILSTLAQHLFGAIRLFIDAGGILSRYTLLTRPLFNWLSLVGFWSGVFVLARRFREPVSLLIFCSLFVTWLPGLLSEDPVQELRLLSVLPFYYILMAVGFVSITQWLIKKLRPGAPVWWIGLTATLFPLLLSGSLTTYDYFYRWADSQEAYAENRGEIFDIAQLTGELSKTTTVILPFEIYSYPSTRYLLDNNFEEEVLDPTRLVQNLSRDRQTVLLGTTDAWPPQSGLAWITRDEAGQGVIYISNLLPQLPLYSNSTVQPIVNNNDTLIGYSQQLDTDALKSMLVDIDPPRPVQAEFAHLLELVSYHLTPPVVSPGGFSALDLYWRGVNTQELGGDVFIQLVDLDGAPAFQMHEPPFSSQVSRWHWNVLIPGRHLIWVGADLPPGPYVIQLGLFEPGTQKRFEVVTPAGQVAGHQFPLGLLYVSDNGDPRIPETPSEFELDNGVTFIGYSSSESAYTDSSITLDLHWYSEGSLENDYTIFAHLLDEQNRIVSQVDVQPFNGLYPTSYWQPDEIVVSRLVLPLPEKLPLGHYRLAVGMYDPTIKARVKVLSETKQQLNEDRVILLDIER